MDPIRIVFVSCAYATHRPVQPAWLAILDTVPTIDVLLMMGDNAYMNWDGPAWQHDQLAQCYQAQRQVAGYQDVIDRARLRLAIWDDHDAGPNNVCGADAPDDIGRSRALFDHHMGFAANVGQANMWAAIKPAPGVRLLLTDGRTHRTKPSAANATVLGGPQESWLWSELDEPGQGPLPIDIVVSGVGYEKGAQDERLLAYPTFAEALDKRLRFRPAQGQDFGRRALLLAGDIHRNAFVRHGTTHHPWYEVISSGVACFKPGTYTLADFVPANHTDNWGLLTITDDAVDIQCHGTMGPDPHHHHIDRKTWVHTQTNNPA